MYSCVPLLHSRYGAHLSKEQVAEIVAPHTDTLELVSSWLEYNGVSSSMVSMTHGGSWLTVSGIHVSQANDLLGASYQLYRHTTGNITVLRTIRYGLPAELHGHVQTVVPTTYFGSPGTPWQTPPVRSSRAAEAPAKEASGELLRMLSSRDEFVTPSFLRRLYKTKGYVPTVAGQNMLGIGAFLRQYPSPDDLRIFMNEFRTDGADATYRVVRIHGGEYDPNNPGLEGNHNVQYSAAIAYPTPLIYYSTGGTGGTSQEDDPFINWLKYLLKQQSIPQTITTTFGADEHVMPPDLAGSVCFLFAQLGVRGVSVLVVSGDDGVGRGDCKDTSGNVHFLPIFPATCTWGLLRTARKQYTSTYPSHSPPYDALTGPWVTTVGGTTNNPEVAARLSGGGFSNYFPRPRYQDDAVATFLENLGSQYDGLYKCVCCCDQTGPILTSFVQPFGPRLSRRLCAGAQL